VLIESHQQRGISLIELIIGLAIVAALFAMGVPSFSDFMQNSRIRSAAEAIQNGLNVARAEAVRRNTNVLFIPGAGSSWTVECAAAVADTDEDDDGAPDCPGSEPTATTPSNIQARPAGEGTANVAVASAEVVAATGEVVTTPLSTIGFNGFGRASTLNPANNAVFNISNPGGGNCVTADGPMRCLRVVVTPGGQIRMCDPALTVSRPTDPQAC